MKLDWKAGVPSKDGIYWFDSGLDAPGQDIGEAFILTVNKSYKVLFASCGSGPLDTFYSKKYCPFAVYAEIPKAPDDWQDISSIKEHHTRAWIKAKDGKLGFGIFCPGNHFNIEGTAYWLKAPTILESGAYYAAKDGYLVKSVKCPTLSLKEMKAIYGV